MDVFLHIYFMIFILYTSVFNKNCKLQTTLDENGAVIKIVVLYMQKPHSGLAHEAPHMLPVVFEERCNDWKESVADSCCENVGNRWNRHSNTGVAGVAVRIC